MPYAAFDLTGKVALVTGGNGGIGFGFAEGIAQAGGEVVIWGTHEDKNAQAAARLRQYGGKVRAHVVDVSQEQEVVDGVSRLLEDAGRLDAVFANAGVAEAVRFVDMSTDLFRRVHAVNLEGAFWTLREAARHMVARAKAGDPGGSLIVVSSLAAERGLAGNEAYASSKGAVISMMRSIAVEFGRFGVRANAILPGWIATDMTSLMQSTPEKVLPRVPVGRWGRTEDFGGLAIYLASDASAFHTGDSIFIDGGLHLSGLIG